jgi:hypothetical protein
MSSATVLFVLRDVLAHASPADHGAPVLSFAFGPGLTMEAMLLGISIPSINNSHLASNSSAAASATGLAAEILTADNVSTETSLAVK